jgi:hypothetical protein
MGNTRNVKVACAFAVSSSISLISAKACADETLPAPKIYFNGENIAGKDKPITVAIGQEINLWSNKDGASRNWVIDGPVVGALAAAQTAGVDCPLSPTLAVSPCLQYPPPLTTTDATIFYFINTGNYEVTYSYTTKEGTANARALFTVVGPTDVKVRPHTGTMSIELIDGQWTISVGLPIDKLSGVTLVASAHQPENFPGSFFWSQVIETDLLTFDKPGVAYACPNEPGLDNSIPYEGEYTDLTVADPIPNNALADSPTTPLDPTWTIARRQFNATATLAWQPTSGTAGLSSMPVAIGTVSWTFYAEAVQQNNVWTLSKLSHIDQPEFSVPSGYIEAWSSVVPKHAERPLCNPV